MSRKHPPADGERHLKKSRGVLCQGSVAVTYTWIREHQAEFPVSLMCPVLEVSTSGYYAWREREPSATHRQRDHQLTCAVTRSYLDSDKSYGYRKV